MEKSLLQRFKVWVLSWVLLLAGVGLFAAETQSLALIEKPFSDLTVEYSSRELANGSIAFVTLQVPKKWHDKKMSGEFASHSFPIFRMSEAGMFGAVISIPYDQKPGPAIVSIKIGDELIQNTLTIIDGKYKSESLKVDGRRVNPTSPKDLARIQKEVSEVGEIYDKITEQKFWSGPFSWPIQSPITSKFGTKRVYNGQLKNFHPGLDLKAPLGTPVRTAAPGIVVMAKSLFYTGNTVMIDHGYGVITLYAHLSRLKVKKGDQLKENQLVGLSGKTGRVNGPHLHWQAVVNHVKIDPVYLTQVMR